MTVTTSGNNLGHDIPEMLTAAHVLCRYASGKPSSSLVCLEHPDNMDLLRTGPFTAAESKDTVITNKISKGKVSKLERLVLDKY